MISQVNTPPPSEVADLTSSALQNAGTKPSYCSSWPPFNERSGFLDRAIERARDFRGIEAFE
jgi:hypothetical protein